MVLFDGDGAGKKLQKASKALLERLEVPSFEMKKDSSIEDYILFPEIFLAAVEETIRMAAEFEKLPLPPDVKAIVEERWKVRDAAQTVGRWFVDTAKVLLSGQEASKVALARNYAFRCRDSGNAPPEGEAREVALVMCRDIAHHLNLTGIKARQTIEM
jgi:hypothetical protein